jgi:hypothetical protein
MTIRTVTSHIVDLHGAAKVGDLVTFRLLSGMYTATEHAPPDTDTATIDASGNISVVLYCPANYQCSIAGAMQFRFTLPDSTAPTTLESLHISAVLPVTPTNDLQSLIDAHEADPDPHPQYQTAAEVAGVYAPLASPVLTGTPAAPTAGTTTNTTQLATTAFVQAPAGAVPHAGSAPTLTQALDLLSGPRFHVRAFGAIPTLSDTTTKSVNRSAFNAAVVAATAAGGGEVFIDHNTYYLSKYVLASAAHNVTFKGDGGAILVYPSDDVTVVTDGTADLLQKARSAIYLLNSNNVRFEGVQFLGSAVSSDINVQLGGGVYARGCTDLKMDNCVNTYGRALLQQDATATDVGTRLTACTSYGARGSLTVGLDAVITGCRFELPTTSTYDRIDATHGSSHAIYLFAGRRNTIIQGCTFKNIRTQGVKVSGSSLPIRLVSVIGCIFDDCGGGVEFGADDQQEHSGLICTSNHFYNCGTNKVFWNENQAVRLLGVRSAIIDYNFFYYTRDSLTIVSAISGISIARYTATSCPLESVSIRGNMFQALLTTTWAATTAYNIVTSLVHPVVKNGLHYAATVAGTSGGSEPVWPTIEGATVVDGSVTWICRGLGDATLPDLILTQAVFITDVGVGASTYGNAAIVGNQINNVGANGITAQRNVGLLIQGNTFTNVVTAIGLTENRLPVIRGNILVPGSRTSANAQIRLNGDSFPTIDGNTTAGRILGAPGQSWSISDAVGSAGAVDFPLLGTHGRCLPSNGRPEIVFAYGGGWVDGDSVIFNGTTWTYKTTSPGATQFNSMAGLIALIDAVANIGAADYGAGFAVPVVTNHIRIRWDVLLNTPNAFFLVIIATNPTAGVVLAEGTGANVLRSNARGDAAAATRSVIWSPLAHVTANVNFNPDNAAAATLLAANAPYVTGRTINDSGAVLVIEHGVVAGGEEFRWSLSA